MQDILKSTKQRFYDRHWRVTSSVTSVLQAFAETKIPLSVKGIVKRLKTTNFPHDSSTVYRVIEKLVETHILHEVGQGRYRLCSDTANELQHHFMLCEICGEAEEIFLNYLDSISGQLAQEKKFTLQNVELTFRGVCKDCAKL